MASSFEIRFTPDGRSHMATGPIPLFMAAASCGIVLEQPCGSLGTCGNCRVRVVAGDVPPSPQDLDLLSEEEIHDGWRLSCRMVVGAGATIDVPPSVRSLGGKSFGGDLALRDGRQPVAMAPMEGGEPALGLAVDIGSTSLAAALVDLRDGRVVTSDSTLNPQVMYGADVISRIHYSVAETEGLARLTAAVREGLRDLVEGLKRASGARTHDVVVAACAGNPTMVQTWAGVSVASLGTAPFLGAWSDELNTHARAMALAIHPDAPVYVFPMVRSHVGSDAVAAAVASEMDAITRPTLLVDLGTNTEVMLAAGGRFVATSAAAGPAFEGATITHGMRAAPGAIDAVSVTPDGRLVCSTVGSEPARGICGSGLIDAAAELLRAGAISPAGHLRPPSDADPPLAPDLARRMITIDGQNACVLVEKSDAHDGRAVVLTARDVRQLQLVKGSILAAATIVCRHLGLEPGDLDTMLIAGAFGNTVRKASAIGIGLVPAVDPEHVRFVGNAAGIGARLAVCDQRIRERAGALAARSEYVELGNHPEYQDLFLELLAFPARPQTDETSRA
jgi:uncharacterized 2Fe-2S/4Fe-4S cluster protein (DUF4445 family)